MRSQLHGCGRWWREHRQRIGGVAPTASLTHKAMIGRLQQRANKSTVTQAIAEIDAEKQQNISCSSRALFCCQLRTENDHALPCRPYLEIVYLRYAFQRS